VISVIGGRSREWVIFEERASPSRAGDRLHRRWELRPSWLRDRCAGRPHQCWWYRCGLCGRPGAHECGRVAELTRPAAIPTFASLNASCSTGPGCAGAVESRSGGRPCMPALMGPSLTTSPGRFPESSPTAWALTGTSRPEPSSWLGNAGTRLRKHRKIEVGPCLLPGLALGGSGESPAGEIAP